MVQGELTWAFARHDPSIMEPESVSIDVGTAIGERGRARIVALARAQDFRCIEGAAQTVCQRRPQRGNLLCDEVWTLRLPAARDGRKRQASGEARLICIGD